MKTLHAYAAVSWIDSVRQEGPTPQAGMRTPIEVFSAGYVVAETDGYIILARDLVDDCYQGVLCIPARSIVTRRTLFPHFSENEPTKNEPAEPAIVGISQYHDPSFKEPAGRNIHHSFASHASKGDMIP